MDLVGKILGQYQIVEPIGRGGMAAVYKAHQPVLDRHVAIKVLMPQQADTPEFRARFLREAKAIAQLNHPNILPIIDYGQTDELIYIVMKYVSGGTLSDRLKHPLDLAASVSLIAQIAAALDHAHQRGIIHRDVKPSNVLLDEGEWVQLADFGLAKILASDHDLTTSGLSMGTPAYLSPEQGEGRSLDHHADIYSLGVIVYEMVTGRLPFAAETPMGVIVKHIYDEPPSPRLFNPELPEAIETVVLKGLAKPIEQRYHSAGELAAAFQFAVAATSASALAHLAPLDLNVMPAAARPIPTTSIVVSNKILFEETVPVTPHVIGREAELSSYRTQLERDRFVVITGLAGIGKTTLGAKLAREAAAHPDNVFWFTFDQVEKSTTEALYWALATFLDNRGEPSLARYLRGEIGAQKPLERMAKLNLLIAALSTGDYVLGFDDVQIAKAAPEVAYIFKVIRQRYVELKQPLPARFILMGRELPADLEYLVPQALQGLSQDETQQFLLERKIVLPRERVAQLWQHTSGNPKLLELSAGALQGLTDEAAFDVIVSLLRRSDIRDYLMRNIYSALTPDEQIVMGALSVFPSPIERAGLEELLAEENFALIAQHIDTLINKHVLTLSAGEQIDCHDLVREYCYHVLSRRDRDRFHGRAAHYFEQEQNWLAAAYHHFERREFDRSLDLLKQHTDAIINAGQAGAMSNLLARFNVVTLTPAQRVHLHIIQSQAYRIQGEYQPAIDALTAALDEVTTDLTRAELLRLISRVYLKMGEYHTALNFATGSLKQSEAINDPLSIAESQCDIGWAYYRMAKLDRSRLHFEISHQLAQQLNQRHFLAEVNLGLGVVAWREQRPAVAEAYFLESGRLFREFGDRALEAYAIANLALIYHFQPAESEQAVRYYRQALRITEEIGDVNGLLHLYNNLGHVHLLRGEDAQAREYYLRTLTLAQHSGQHSWQSLAGSGLADLALRQQDTSQALEYADLAQRAGIEAGSSLELGIAYRTLGDVWLQRGDAAQAQTYYQRSLPILEQHKEVDELTKARTGYAAASQRLSDAVNSNSTESPS